MRHLLLPSTNHFTSYIGAFYDRADRFDFLCYAFPIISSWSLGVRPRPYGYEDSFMGYTTFKPLGSWGVYDFPICVCFARCCRRSGSILFCTRVTTGIFTMSSVSSLSLSQYSFLFYFSSSFTPFSSLPHCSSSSFFWYDVLDVWNYFSLIDILHATKEMERKKKDVSLFPHGDGTRVCSSPI